MSVSIPDFWRLLIDSQLLPPAECQRLGQQFGYVKGAADQGNARTLAEWLIAQNVISRYQSTILLAGRPGPFAYGDYKIYDRLEDGPLAGQFKAVHAPSGHPVVLKFFAGETVADQHRWTQTAERAVKHASIAHPHWWRSFELVDLDQFKFQSLQDVSAVSVAQRLAGSQRIGHREACRIAFQVALAMGRMHEAGFIHGALCPECIMLDAEGRALLWCDVSRPTAIGGDKSDADLLARADYFAPELAAVGASANALTDVYALGCTLYQMLSGEVPFAGGDFQRKMQRHAGEAIQPLAPFGVPEPVARAVAYMMAKNTAVRYQDAAHVADQLGQLLDPAERQPRVATTPSTLAALEQHLKTKPKPSITHVRPAQAAPVAPIGTGVATAAPAALAGRTAPTTTPAATLMTAGAGAVAAASGGSATASPSAAGPALSDRYKQKKPLTKNKPLLILLSCGVAFLLTMGVLYASGAFRSFSDQVATSDDGNGEDTTPSDNQGGSSDPPDAIGEETSGSENGAAGNETDVPRFTLVAQDDGQTLWLPPTTGAPVDMTFVPPQAQVYLIARPSELLASPYGADAIKALGPDFEKLRGQWESTAGVKLSEVERLVIGVHPNDSQMPRFSSTVLLKTAADMPARWGNPTAGGNNVYAVKGQKAWVPPAAGGRVFVLGAAQEIDTLAGGPSDKPLPQLGPYFTPLLESSDGSQHVVALFDPQFFHTDGRDMFIGPYAKLIDPLEQFFGDEAKGMLSLHFGDEFYGELRLYARLQKTPAELAREFDVKLQNVPTQIDEYSLSLNAPDYWKRLLRDYPQMARHAQRQARIGAEDEQTVINVSLPPKAGSYLLAGGEFLAQATPGATYTGGPTVATAKPSPKTLDELLAAKVDLGFPQRDLELAMDDLAAAARDEYPELPLDFQIKIIGADLQKEGITRNQQIRDFNAKGTPVGEILTQLVRKANPVTTVQSPAEIDQKLVWLVGPDPDNPSNKIVLITTRAAASEKKWTLPAVFQPK